MSSNTPFLPAAVQAALDQGNRLEAVRLLRERYALGLKESMEVIAGIRRLPGASLSSQEPQAAAQDMQPRHTHAQAHGTTHTHPHAPPELGNTVAAALRALLASRLPSAAPEQPAEALFRDGLAPGEVPRGTGSWVLVVFVAALLGSYVLFR
jgi:hypothetical protein